MRSLDSKFGTRVAQQHLASDDVLFAAGASCGTGGSAAGGAAGDTDSATVGSGATGRGAAAAAASVGGGAAAASDIPDSGPAASATTSGSAVGGDATIDGGVDGKGGLTPMLFSSADDDVRSAVDAGDTILKSSSCVGGVVPRPARMYCSFSILMILFGSSTTKVSLMSRVWSCFRFPNDSGR